MKSLGILMLGGVVGIGLGMAYGHFGPQVERATAPKGIASLEHRTAPDFSLPDSRRQNAVRLADYKGKVVLLNFFETSCPHCLEELPELVKIHHDMRAKGVEVIGVALDPEGAKELGGLAKSLGIAYPLAVGNEDVAALYGGIEGVPTSFLIDRQGRIVKIFSGVVGYSDLAKAIMRVD